MSFFLGRQRLIIQTLRKSPAVTQCWLPQSIPKSFQCSKSTKSTKTTAVGPKRKRKPAHINATITDKSTAKSPAPLPYREPAQSAKQRDQDETIQEEDEADPEFDRAAKTQYLTESEAKQEFLVQQRIMKNRKKLLGPGIFAVSAVLGIFGTFAYLDTRVDAKDTELAPRAEPPQPKGFIDGFRAARDGAINGFKELDKLTIGLIALYAGIHILKRSPLPLWERLLHIAGEKKYTLLTYQFAHGSWGHVAGSVVVLAWFMPSVVRHFDGDYLHTAALYLSVPVLTGFFTHLQFKGKGVKGIPMELGASGALSAMIGAFAVIHPHEKLQLPIPLRVEASTLALLYGAYETVNFAIGLRMAMPFVSHGVSFVQDDCCLPADNR